MDELLRVEGLRKFFRLDKGRAIAAVSDVSFTLRRGETLGLVGESGSGKTTVGRCVLRLIPTTGGRVIFKGVDITKLPDTRLRALRHSMQLVFQDYFASLNPRWQIRDLVEEPLILEGHHSRDDRSGRIRRMLSLVNLTEKHLAAYPGQLTGSEQQRVGIARALITNPDLVVLDEPTSNLDSSSQAEILDVLVGVQEEFGTAYIFISHDLMAVERVSGRIAIMYLGRIVETAETSKILARHYHPYSRALLSAVLYPDPKRALPQFVLEGEIPTAVNPPEECALAGRCPLAESYCRESVPPLTEVATGHFAACYRSREVSTLAGSLDTRRNGRAR